MGQLSARHIQVLVGMTLIWGMNWPVMKFAVSNYPPLAFRFFCMVLGVMAMWMIAAALKVSLKVPVQKIPRILMLALPNMIGWHVLCILGVSQLSSGRAAILGYTMPVWAVLAGLVWGQAVPSRGWVGLALSMVAMFLLMGAEINAIAGSPLGVLLMSGAALCWGFGTAMIRRFPHGLHPLTFTHAMLLPTLVVMGAASLLLEGSNHGLPEGFDQWWPVLYNAIGVFAFCQVGWFYLASTLPPIASSLSVMLIPVVGVISGALALNEVPRLSDYLALGLILAAMSVVLITKRKDQ